MIIDSDLSSLEWRVAAELCQDELMIKEIVDGIDIHTANSEAIFGDKNHRQESKVISFRSLYGGTPYAFYMDVNMPNFSLKRWEEIAEAFNTKYKGLIDWQNRNYAQVVRTGKLSTFTGRTYCFKSVREKDGSFKYNRPSVCNYPVQGCATGDVMPLLMCQVLKRLRKDGATRVKIINQVHDSIVFDAPESEVQYVADICYELMEKLPQSISKFWNYTWRVPMTGEVKAGDTWGNMKLVQRSA